MLLSSLPEPVQKYAAGVIERERKEMIRETDTFLKQGMITPNTAAKHKAELKAADLSFTEGGELELTPVVVRHQTYRDLVPQSAFSKADLSNLEEVAATHGLDGKDDQSKADEAAVEYALGRMGLAAK